MDRTRLGRMVLAKLFVAGWPAFFALTIGVAQAQTVNPVPPPPPPVFNPSAPNTVPQPRETPVSPATPGALPGANVLVPSQESPVSPDDDFSSTGGHFSEGETQGRENAQTSNEEASSFAQRHSAGAQLSYSILLLSIHLGLRSVRLRLAAGVARKLGAQLSMIWPCRSDAFHSRSPGFNSLGA